MYRKILVLVDNRKITQSAIDHAITLAQAQGAGIFFFGMLPYPDCPEVVNAFADEFKIKASEEVARMLADASSWAEHCGVHNQRAVGTGAKDAYCVVDAAIAQHCDLIVVGSVDQNAEVDVLSGRIISGLIASATVPVLLCSDRPIRPKCHKYLRSSFATNSLNRREIGSRRNDEPND